MTKLLSFAVLTILGVVFAVNANAQKQVIPVWNYYLSPPFQIDQTTGFASDFVELLNEELGAYYQFELDSIPRKRLNKYLNQNRQGIVLFVNWSWMGNGAKQKYLWTSPVLQDSNEVISANDNKIYYEGPDSVKGLTLGTVRGHRFPELEGLLKANVVHRFDVTRQKQLFSLLLNHRFDFTIQPKSIAMVLVNETGIRDKVFFSPKPLRHFTRHIMLTADLYQLYKPLNELATHLHSNEKWLDILRRYNLNELVPISEHKK